MKSMRKGELAFFYHSNCKIPGIAGIMEITRESEVDGKLNLSLSGPNASLIVSRVCL